MRKIVRSSPSVRTSHIPLIEASHISGVGKQPWDSPPGSLGGEIFWGSSRTRGYHLGTFASITSHARMRWTTDIRAGLHTQSLDVFRCWSLASSSMEEAEEPGTEPVSGTHLGITWSRTTPVDDLFAGARKQMQLFMLNERSSLKLVRLRVRASTPTNCHAPGDF